MEVCRGPGILPTCKNIRVGMICKDSSTRSFWDYQTGAIKSNFQQIPRNKTHLNTPVIYFDCVQMAICKTPPKTILAVRIFLFWTSEESGTCKYRSSLHELCSLMESIASECLKSCGVYLGTEFYSLYSPNGIPPHNWRTTLNLHSSVCGSRNYTYVPYSNLVNTSRPALRLRVTQVVSYSVYSSSQALRHPGEVAKSRQFFLRLVELSAKRPRRISRQYKRQTLELSGVRDIFRSLLVSHRAFAWLWASRFE